MSTLSVHDLQGFSTYNNTVRIPSGHNFTVEGKFILPTYAQFSDLPTSGNITGELSFVTNEGRAYIWTGFSWVNLGGGLKGYSSANPASSPNEILQNNPNATDGAYWYDFGTGSFQAYTDFSGGGYLLVAKLPSTNDISNPWNYVGNRWSSSSPVNESSCADLSAGDGLNRAFYEYTLTSGFKMCLGTISNALYESVTGSTAKTVFTGSQRSSDNDRNAFLSWFEVGTGVSRTVFDNQPNCNTRGFNVTSVSAVRMRWGITMNNENDCNTNDSAVGFGTYTNNQSATGVRNVVAGGHRWSPDVRYPAQGYIFVK